MPKEKGKKRIMVLLKGIAFSLAGVFVLVNGYFNSNIMPNQETSFFITLFVSATGVTNFSKSSIHHFSYLLKKIIRVFG